MEIMSYRDDGRFAYQLPAKLNVEIDQLFQKHCDEINFAKPTKSTFITFLINEGIKNLTNTNISEKLIKKEIVSKSKSIIKDDKIRFNESFILDFCKDFEIQPNRKRPLMAEISPAIISIASIKVYGKMNYKQLYEIYQTVPDYLFNEDFKTKRHTELSFKFKISQLIRENVLLLNNGYYSLSENENALYKYRIMFLRIQEKDPSLIFSIPNFDKYLSM